MELPMDIGHALASTRGRRVVSPISSRFAAWGRLPMSSSGYFCFAMILYLICS